MWVVFVLQFNFIMSLFTISLLFICLFLCCLMQSHNDTTLFYIQCMSSHVHLTYALVTLQAVSLMVIDGMKNRGTMLYIL